MAEMIARRNHVWIELVRPILDPRGKKEDALPSKVYVRDQAELRAYMETQCRLANAMLRKLIAPDDWSYGDDGPFFVYEDKGEYLMYAKSMGGSGFQPLSDHGAWFNLDYLGREA